MRQAIIKNLLVDAQILQAVVDGALNYPKNGTLSHSVPFSNGTQTLWAYEVDETSVSLVDSLTVSELPSDWYDDAVLASLPTF